MNYIQQAYKGKNSWWRWFVVLLVLLSPYLFGLYEYFFEYDKQLKGIESLKNYSGNTSDLILKPLTPYLFYLPLLFLGVKFIHKRSMLSVINSVKNIRFQRVFFAFVSLGVLLILLFVLEYYLYPERFVYQFKQKEFLTLLAIVFFLSPIKVAFQEIFFRGYLMQGLARLLGSKWLAILFVAILFGVFFSLHAQSDYLEFNLLFFYIMTDVFLGVIVLMDEGVELAIGMNWVNNILAFTLVSYEWMILKTDSLFVDLSSVPNYIFQLYIPVFLLYPLYIFILSKTYGWKQWKEKLFTKVIEPKTK